MTPADKLLTQIKEDRENLAQDTAIIKSALKAGWLHDERAEASELIDSAANTWERKNRQLEIAVDAIQKAKQYQSTKATREELLKYLDELADAMGKALEEMEAVK